MRSTGFQRNAAAFVCLCILLFASGGLAQSVQMSAVMGYDGVATYLRQLPVAVEVVNNGADAAGVLAIDVDRSDTEYDRYSLPLSVAAGATVRVTLPVTLTMKQESYQVQWLVNGEPAGACEATPANITDPSWLMVGLLSDDPQQLAYLNLTQRGDVLKRGEYWRTVALSRDNFPADSDGMGFFDLLVVDGMDLSTLDKEQQVALDGWLRSGGIVLLGGGAQAAAGFPFFERYTGISAGELRSSETLTGELLRLFKLSEAPLEEPVATVGLDGAAGRAVGDHRLLDVTRADSGVVLTASFSLSEKPLSAWLGKNAIWQRTLLQYAQSRYQSAVEKRAYGSNAYRYVDSEVANAISIPNQGATALPVVILALFVAMAGFGGYFLLKRRDKTSWMWALVPGLAVACSLVIWGASGMLGLQKPVAVSYTLVEIGKDGAQSSLTGMSIAKAAKGSSKVRVEQGTVNMDAENGYYYESDDRGEGAAKKLRYQYELGPAASITFPGGNAAWSPAYFLVENVPVANVAVSGAASWEDGALVFSVKNDGAVALSDGVILTNYGFVSTPALLPGQTLSARMVANATSITDSSGLKDGMLLNEAERRLCSFYDYINTYRRGNKDKTDPTLGIKYSLLSCYGNQANWYSGNGISDPMYFAFSDSLAQIDLSVNGEPVTRKGQMDMVCATLSFSPVSESGSVRFLSGNIPVSAAEVDDQGTPHQVETTPRQNRYPTYRLSESPVFAFDMTAAPQDWTLEHFDIGPRYSYYSYEVSLYRVRDGQWVSFKTNEYDQSSGKDKVNLVLPKLQEYVDDDGFLYARFTSYGKTMEYSEVDSPALTMDGRLN